MQDADFVRYYIALKNLQKIHVELGLGNHPPIPSGFSERLCRRLCGLEEWKGREFDASSNGKGIEIKATGDAVGTTTINLEPIVKAEKSFGGIKWIYFDFQHDEVHIAHIPPESLADILRVFKKKLTLPKGKKAKEPRDNITLSKLAIGQHAVFIVDTEKFTLSRKSD